MSSREFKGKRVVLWPSNINSSVSVSRGRKIPLRHAVKDPTIEEIVKAAEKLGLDPAIEDKAYPSAWWTERRRVVVNKVGSKRRTLILIAERIKSLREKGDSS
jgi:signal recognition particle subunit SRP19